MILLKQKLLVETKLMCCELFFGDRSEEWTENGSSHLLLLTGRLLWWQTRKCLMKEIVGLITEGTRASCCSQELIHEKHSFIQRLNISTSLLHEKKSTSDTEVVTMLFFGTLTRLQRDVASESLGGAGHLKVACEESYRLLVSNVVKI